MPKYTPEETELRRQRMEQARLKWQAERPRYTPEEIKERKKESDKRGRQRKAAMKLYLKVKAELEQVTKRKDLRQILKDLSSNGLGKEELDKIVQTVKGLA